MGMILHDSDGNLILWPDTPECIVLPKQSKEDVKRAKMWRDKYFGFLDKHIAVSFQDGTMTICSDGEEYTPSEDETMKA